MGGVESHPCMRSYEPYIMSWSSPLEQVFKGLDLKHGVKGITVNGGIINPPGEAYPVKAGLLGIMA